MFIRFQKIQQKQPEIVKTITNTLRNYRKKLKYLKT